MATALYSGCDVLSNWSTAGYDIVHTQYGGTNQNGSIGPPATTYMSFVGKYVTNLSTGDFAEILGAGVSVFFYFENGSIQGSYTGFTYAQGVTDAHTVLSNLSGLGLLPTQPVYYAIDFDANTVGIASYIVNYFQGIIDTVGAATDTVSVGMYGSAGAFFDLGQALNAIGYEAPTYFAQSRSSGWRNNANLDMNTNVWQWPPGYSPSGNVVINGHGVDGCFAYTTDFGQYPRARTSGILTYATVTNPTMTFTQPEVETISVPQYNYDHVIFSDTIEISVSGSVWPQSIDGPATNINQTAYPIGNFSFDNGLTWQDFGFIEANDFGTFYGELPEWVIQPVIDDLGNLTFNVSFPQAGSASANFIINIAIMASYSPSPLPDTYVTQSTAYSNLVPNVNPPYATYRRIAEDIAVGGGTYPHHLGTIPNLLFWQYDTSNFTDIAPSRWSSSGGIGGELGIAMDSTNIYVHVDSSTQDVFLRTYYDN